MANGAWAMGEDFSLADCAAAPPLFYGNMVVPFGEAQKNLAAYLERLKARPSFVRVLKEAEPYFQMVPKEPGRSVEWLSQQGGYDPRHLCGLSRQRPRNSSRTRSATISASPVPTTTISTSRPISSGAGRAATGSNGTSWSGFSSKAMKPLSPTAASPRGGKDVSQYRILRLRGRQGKRIDVYFGATYDNGAFIKQPG